MVQGKQLLSRKYKIEMKNRKNNELSELVMWYLVMNKGFIDDNYMLEEFLIEKLFISVII